jgi:AhpD family alkylhydroperoxidase
MANSPTVLQGFAQLNGAVNAGHVSAKLRESIALLSAETNACDYCLSAHSALGKAAGLTPDQLSAARDGKATDPKTAAALTFASRIIETRGGVTDNDVSAVRAAGWTDAELAEIVSVIALNYFTNIFNRTFAVDIDFPKVEARRGAA